MRKSLMALLAAAMLGCAWQPRPTAQEAVIIFILPSMTGMSGFYQPSYGATPAVSLHEISRPERKMVGVLTIGQKLAYRASPGKHEFMLVNRGSTDFMEANVVAGKNYYVVIQRTDDSYDQRYAFKPVRPGDFDSGAFQRWENNVSYVEKPLAWERWNASNGPSVDVRLKQFKPAWDKQDPAERRLRTLQVSDGR